MVAFAKRLRKSFLGQYAISVLHEAECVLIPRLISDEKAVRSYYKKIAGEDLDLENPSTFCEKTNAYKLTSRGNALMVQCADKLAVRDYVSGKGFGGSLNDLIAVYGSPKEIDLESLPERFVIKASHGSHMGYVVKDKAKVNLAQMKRMFGSWLRQDIYWSGREWPYKDTPRKIVVERYLEDANGELRDYKFFCFHGKPVYLEYDIGRYTGSQYRNYYDMAGNLQPFHDSVMPLETEPFPMPMEKYTEMQEMASALSEPFEQVRVDLYLVEDKIYFGEMTFFDGGGSTLFEPEEWNYKFSEQWIWNRRRIG